MPTLQRLWMRTGLATLLLAPLALIFALVVWLRRLAYRRGWRASVAVGVPVVVVGNLSVGGSGKTPLTIWLVDHLRAQGWRPGVVSRGYGGSARGCAEVMPDSDPALIGDEPLLIRLKTDVPVVVGRDRVAAECAVAHPSGHHREFAHLAVGQGERRRLELLGGGIELDDQAPLAALAGDLEHHHALAGLAGLGDRAEVHARVGHRAEVLLHGRHAARQSLA